VRAFPFALLLKIIIRRLLGDFYIPAFQCPHHTERVGRRGDGGKWVCGVDRVAKQEKCVAYSFGQPWSFLKKIFFLGR
jgi:Methyltransferase domain